MNCIFHIPNYIDELGTSGSQIRPRKMLQAFRNIGYNVDAIMGYGAERKKQIAVIKEKIRKGYKYDFLYSESSTMPTLLTEKHHYPTYPNLDFGFFSFVKEHNIPIGLFYRDIYWMFPFYGKSIVWWKRIMAKTLYRYDLLRYHSLLDVLFLPSLYMKDWIPYGKIGQKTVALPPGVTYDDWTVRESKCFFDTRRVSYDGTISLFYVGGIDVSGLYQFDKLFNVVSTLPFVKLTVCCREPEWEAVKHVYGKNINDRIQIIHKYGKELECYYNEADICVLWFKETAYRKISMPVKMLEYMAHGKPQIATSGNAQAEFIKMNAIGWDVPYKEEAMKKLLSYVHDNYHIVIAAHENSIRAIEKNTWDFRALTARDILLNVK